MKQIAKVGIYFGDKLCLGIRNDDGLWTLPGGHLDEGETPVEGAIREVEEETGVQFGPEDLEFLGTKTVTKPDGEDILVHSFVAFADEKRTTTKEDPDSEVTRWEWIDVSKGLPEEIKNSLHVPAERDVTLQALGLVTPDQMETLAKALAQILDISISHKRRGGPASPVEGLSQETATWLKKFLDQASEDATNYGAWRTPPSLVVLQELEPFSMKESKQLYRGLFFHDMGQVTKAFGLTEFPRPGDELVYNDEYASSWSVSPEIAEGFAAGDDNYQMVIEYHAKPEESLLDTELLPEEFCKQTYDGCGEREVVLCPGRFKTKVVRSKVGQKALAHILTATNIKFVPSNMMWKIVKDGVETGYGIRGGRFQSKQGVSAEFFLITPKGEHLKTGYVYMEDFKNFIKEVAARDGGLEKLEAELKGS
jgi:ADP-ribose pyrophosphatase YjhB (NUDIX family)